MKRKIALALAAVMIAGSFSGCAKSENELREEISRLQSELDKQTGSDSNSETSMKQEANTSDKDFEDYVSKGLITTNVGAITDCAESISGSLTIPDYISKIDSYAFAMCDRLNSVSIPGSVDTIGICAFQNCFELTSISMADGVEVIAESAFTQCKKLTDLELAGTVKKIYSSAFYMCGITSIDLPNVQYIGEHAFARCSDLTEVNIGDSLRSIGGNVFDECTSLTKVTYKGKTYSYANIDEFYDAVNNPDAAEDDEEETTSVSSNIYIDSSGVLRWDASAKADHYVVRASDGTYNMEDICYSNDSVNFAYKMQEAGFPTGQYELYVCGVDRSGDEFFIAGIAYNLVNDPAPEYGSVTDSIYIDSDGVLRWDPDPDAESYIVRATDGANSVEDVCYSNNSANYAYNMWEAGFPIGWYMLNVYGVRANGDEFFISSINYYYE